MSVGYREILRRASAELLGLTGSTLDVVDVLRPPSLEFAVELGKLTSKMSPLISNLIELWSVERLNEIDWGVIGEWRRQDPGFPDATFASRAVQPAPGIEIKAWSPLSTEITARFRESATLFAKPHINVALIAWIPDHVIFGRPLIVNVCVIPAASVALFRDNHYHRPPFYLITEPELTAGRTRNLRQTNVNGYKLQEDQCDVRKAVEVVSALGASFLHYSSSAPYQLKVQRLMGRFPYRLDTNFAKLDRIGLPAIEQFKAECAAQEFYGMRLEEWSALMSTAGESDLKRNLTRLLRKS